MIKRHKKDQSRHMPQPDKTRQQRRPSNLQFSSVSYRTGQTQQSKKGASKRIDASVTLGKRKAWRKIPTMLALLVITGGVLYTLFVDFDARVQIVKNDEMGTLETYAREEVWDASAYQAATQELLRQSWLNYAKPTVRTEAISQALQDQFPEIARAEVRIALVERRPLVRVTLREPKLLVVSPEDQVYMIDKEGQAFPAIEGSRRDAGELPVVHDQLGGIAITAGEQALPKETVRFIEAISHQFAHADIAIASMTLPAVANELHVRPQSDDFVGKFDITSNARLQAGSFLVTYETLKADNIVPDEYIDARVQGRAYYR